VIRIADTRRAPIPDSILKQRKSCRTVIASHRVARMRAPVARNDEESGYDCDLAAQCTRALNVSSAQRGRGECRMPNAPAASCASVVVEGTRVTTSTPESPGIPARNGFNGFLRALPGDRAFLSPSLAEYVVCPHPVGPTCHPANLTPASRRQDHTTSPYAATSLVRSLLTAHKSHRPALRSRRAQNAAASTASLPAFRDDHDTPLCGVGWRESVEMICPTGKAKYFCKWGWTDGQISERRRKLLSCPGRGAALLQRCSAEPGPTTEQAARWTPDQQRTTVARRRRA
jgi:hypothetical protein